jgi:hypothetical protein
MIQSDLRILGNFLLGPFRAGIIIEQQSADGNLGLKNHDYRKQYPKYTFRRSIQRLQAFGINFRTPMGATLSYSY